MDNLVTVATFNYLHEAALLRGRLDAEGVECRIKDDNAMMPNPLYKPVLAGSVRGGVKVQILQSDIKKVLPILKEYGFSTEADSSYNGFVERFISFTEKIPVINKLRLEWRYTTIFIIISILMFLCWLLVYWFNGSSL